MNRWITPLLAIALVSGQAHAQSIGADSRGFTPPGLCSRSIQQPPGPPRGNALRPPPLPWNPSKDIKVDKVRDNLYLIHNVEYTLATNAAYGSNVIVYVTDDGIILIDAKNDRTHDYLVAQVRAISNKPIRYLVLTHNHADHAAGAALLEQMGVTGIISTEDQANLERDSHPAVLPQMAYHAYMQFRLGGKDVQLREVCGHTSGDTIVYLPSERVLMSGDLITIPDAMPQIVAYADHGDWLDELHAMDVMAQMDFDLMIPGHGPPVTKSEFLQQRARMSGVFETVRTMTRNGRPLKEILPVVISKYHYGSGFGAAQVAQMVEEVKQEAGG